MHKHKDKDKKEVLRILNTNHRIHVNTHTNSKANINAKTSAGIMPTTIHTTAPINTNRYSTRTGLCIDP
ncbi:hypothetical protein ID866_11767 [Astraeus odoratus]|nr:hypothetical protein ID866_11767 [Astraeus odoratus]